MTMRAQAAAQPRHHGAFASPVCDPPCRLIDGLTSGPAMPVAQTQSGDGSTQTELRRMMLAAMRDRRAELIRRAAEARAKGLRKSRWISEAELAGLTRAIMEMEIKG